MATTTGMTSNCETRNDALKFTPSDMNTGLLTGGGMLVCK